MRRRTALAVLGYGFASLSCDGQETGRSSGTLVSRVQWLRFEILLGRFTAISCRQGNCRFVTGGVDDRSQSANVEAASSQPQESLVINSDAQLAAIRYERIETKQHILIEHVPQKETVIQRIPRGGADLPIIDFQQHSRGEVRLEILDGTSRSQHAARSLWHLFIAEPDICRNELTPILECVRPNWSLMDRSVEIRRLIADNQVPLHENLNQEIHRLVAELGDPKFQVRHAADQSIRSIGLSVLPLLDQFRVEELNSEQRFRIKKIEESFSLQTGDTPDRVANWLANDSSIREILQKQAASAGRVRIR